METWRTDDPKRLVGPGHPVGDFLGAPEWEILDKGAGTLRLRLGLPEHLKNPRNELFGGFTAAYVDFVSLHLFHLNEPDGEPPAWLSTANLHVEFFAPIRGPEFLIDGEILQRRGRSAFIELRFRSQDGQLCALGQTTLIQHRSR
jgi:acyl-coenzyme A thioesterase PaaI-like protein